MNELGLDRENVLEFYVNGCINYFIDMWNVINDQFCNVLITLIIKQLMA